MFNWPRWGMEGSGRSQRLERGTMGKIETRRSAACRLLAFTSLAALAGCAQEGVRPAYIGLSDLPAVATATPAQAETPSGPLSDSLRHVQSNKVLGAMAFQKVTGRAVDPDSLSGRGE